MRYPFIAYAAITLVILLVVLSDFVFGDSTWGRLWRRVLLAFVWPLAMLSSSGRAVLFTNGSKL